MSTQFDVLVFHLPRKHDSKQHPQHTSMEISQMFFWEQALKILAVTEFRHMQHLSHGSYVPTTIGQEMLLQQQC